MNSKLFANCKLKEGIPGEPREDDLMLSTRVESISSIKFFNYLQLGDAPKRTEKLPEGTTTLILMHKKNR